MKSWVSIAFAATVPLLAAPVALAQEAATAAPDIQPDIQISRTPATAKVTATGTLTIQAVLTVNKDLPAGTTVNFYGSSSIYDAAYTNMHSVSSTAKVAGGKVSITLKIPYSFLVLARSEKISVSLSANTTAFTSGPTYSFSTYFLSTIALPANGASTVVKYSGSI
jgi:hypothetical protein